MQLTWSLVSGSIFPLQFHLCLHWLSLCCSGTGITLLTLPIFQLLFWFGHRIPDVDQNGIEYSKANWSEENMPPPRNFFVSDSFQNHHPLCQGTTTNCDTMSWPPHTRPRGPGLLQSPSSASLQGDIDWYLNWGGYLYEINGYVVLLSIILWQRGWSK